jgi:hypothetical protein
MESRGLSIDVDLPAREAWPLSAGSRLIAAITSRREILMTPPQAMTTVIACRSTTDGA